MSAHDYLDDGLRAALSAVGERGSVRAAVAHLSRRQGDIDEALGRTVLARIPAFSESHNPELIGQMAAHGSRHTHELLRLLGGGEIGSFDFVREHARRRADQRFPPEAMLHTYRIGHKFYGRVLRDAVVGHLQANEDASQTLSALADFALEYTDVISTIAAAEYTHHSRLLADIAVDERAQLIRILLEGHDESDRRVSSLLRAAGYLDQRQSFCVAVARSADPAEMAMPERARRMVASIDQTLSGSSWRRLIDLHQNTVIMVFSQMRRASGWSAPRRSLAPQVRDALMQVGISARIGISDDMPSTSFIPGAHRAAGTALEFATATRPVVMFSELRVRDLLVRDASDNVRRAVPAWAQQFVESDRRSGGVLSASLKAYADASMNVQKGALRLEVHANTLYARLQKVQDMTGLDPRRFHELNELLLVMELHT